MQIKSILEKFIVIIKEEMIMEEYNLKGDKVCKTTMWRRRQSPEKIKELNEKRRDVIEQQLSLLAKRYRDMSPEERREYNHQRYLRHKDAYKERSKQQYIRNKSK